MKILAINNKQINSKNKDITFTSSDIFHKYISAEVSDRNTLRMFKHWVKVEHHVNFWTPILNFVKKHKKLNGVVGKWLEKLEIKSWPIKEHFEDIVVTRDELGHSVKLKLYQTPQNVKIVDGQEVGRMGFSSSLHQLT